ncbi:hypothetical protein QUA30_24880 [Microcoleus sp. Pol14C2]|uniref:hypothetical protein n=1 Tax=unclassified Microcoleus TaxID=2642155 RepID=UPI002FD48CC2
MEKNKRNASFPVGPSWVHSDRIPPIADLGDGVAETAPEITPEMAPTPSSASQIRSRSQTLRDGTIRRYHSQPQRALSCYTARFYNIQIK